MLTYEEEISLNELDITEVDKWSVGTNEHIFVSRKLG